MVQANSYTGLPGNAILENGLATSDRNRSQYIPSHTSASGVRPRVDAPVGSTPWPGMHSSMPAMSQQHQSKHLDTGLAVQCCLLRTDQPTCERYGCIGVWASANTLHVSSSYLLVDREGLQPAPLMRCSGFRLSCQTALYPQQGGLPNPTNTSWLASMPNTYNQLHGNKYRVSTLPCEATGQHRQSLVM